MKFKNTIEDGISPISFIEPNYPGQYPEQMNIELNLDMQDTPPTLYVETANRRLNGTPEAMWHNRILSWDLPYNVDASFMHDFVENELVEALDTIIENYSIEWNGNNNVGRCDGDIDELIEGLQWIIDKNCPRLDYGGLYSPADYYGEVTTMPDEDSPTATVCDFTITADSSDEELAKIADELEDDVETEGYYVLDRKILSYLEDLRDECRSYD